MEDNDFINQYIALIKSIVVKYYNTGVDFDDMVQEGLLGLLEAKKSITQKRTLNL